MRGGEMTIDKLVNQPTIAGNPIENKIQNHGFFRRIGTYVKETVSSTGRYVRGAACVTLAILALGFAA